MTFFHLIFSSIKPVSDRVKPAKIIPFAF